VAEKQLTRPLTVEDVDDIVRAARTETDALVTMRQFKRYVEEKPVEPAPPVMLLSVLAEETKRVAKAVDDGLDGIEGNFGADRMKTTDSLTFCAMLRTLAHMIERDVARGAR
jgi:hypothetical protein